MGGQPFQFPPILGAQGAQLSQQIPPHTCSLLAAQDK